MDLGKAFGMCLAGTLLIALFFFILPALIMEFIHETMVRDGDPYGIWGDTEVSDTTKDIFHIFKWFTEDNRAENFQKFEKDGILHLNLTDQFGDAVDMRSARIVTCEVDLPDGEGSEIRAFLVLHEFDKPPVIVKDFPPLTPDSGEDILSTRHFYQQIEGELQYRWGLDDTDPILETLGLNEDDFGKYIKELDPISTEKMEAAISEDNFDEHLNYEIIEGTKIKFEFEDYSGKVSTSANIESDAITETLDNGNGTSTTVINEDGSKKITTIETDVDGTITTTTEVYDKSGNRIGNHKSVEQNSSIITNRWKAGEHHINIETFNVRDNNHTYMIQRTAEGQPTDIFRLIPKGAESLNQTDIHGIEVPDGMKTNLDDAVNRIGNYEATEEMVSEANNKIRAIMRDDRSWPDKVDWDNLPIKTMSWAGRRRLIEHVLAKILTL